MGRAVLVVQRRGGAIHGFAAAIRHLNQQLTPDNIEPREPIISYADGAAAAIINPSRVAMSRGCSVRIGAVTDSATSWDAVGSPRPEGTFAIARVSERHIELVADPVGSRTLWYALTREQLIVSTSQRAVVTLLGSFELNESVIPWMLSTGTLGPSGGWDSRVQRVLPRETLTLDRHRWKIQSKTDSVSYERDTTTSRRDHIKRISQVLDDVTRAQDVDTSNWLLPLTGGVDSRGLLSAMLAAGRDVRTITWGLSVARSRKFDDANIAQKVAEEFGVPNDYIPVNLSEEPREKVIDRFLVAGEGGVEAIPPFVDGFAGWKRFYEEGIEGIVRGDQAFGGGFVHTARDARISAAITPLSDFIPSAEVATFELPEQKIPQRLQRQPDETLESWRDRLYEQHRISAFLAPLTSLESAYVEVVNPLLFTRVLEIARRLPDDLRTGKRLWREVVQSRSPSIPFSRRPAVLPLQNFVNDTQTLELMLEEFESQRAADMLSPSLRHRITWSVQSTLNTRAARRPKQSARQVITHAIPFRIRRLVRRYAPAKRPLNPTALAFRAFIVMRMAALLTADASALAENLGRAATK